MSYEIHEISLCVSLLLFGFVIPKGGRRKIIHRKQSLENQTFTEAGQEAAGFSAIPPSSWAGGSLGVVLSFIDERFCVFFYE